MDRHDGRGRPPYDAPVAGACLCGAVGGRVRLRGTFDRGGVSGLPFTVVVCERCGLARTDPPPDDQRYRDSTLTPSMAHEGEAWAPEIVAFLQRLRPDGRLLDVGCNLGAAVEAAAAAGYDATGIDVDPWATEQARRQGRRVLTGELADLPGTYDLITLVHVAEHVAALPDLLRAAADHLAPDGRLVLFVPHHRGLVPRMLGDRWQLWAPHEHLWHFEPTTLVAVVTEATGLEPERVTARGAIEPFGRSWKHRVGRLAQRVGGVIGRGEQIEAVFRRPPA